MLSMSTLSDDRLLSALISSICFASRVIVDVTWLFRVNLLLLLRENYQKFSGISRWSHSLRPCTDTEKWFWTSHSHNLSLHETRRLILKVTPAPDQEARFSRPEFPSYTSFIHSKFQFQYRTTKSMGGLSPSARLFEAKIASLSVGYTYVPLFCIFPSPVCPLSFSALNLPLSHSFLPRDATQSAVLLWQVVCPSVCLFRNVEVLWLHRLEIFKNNFMVS